MKDEQIPDENHVVRYCKSSKCAANGRPTAGAFLLRETELYLSVNWLEFVELEDRSKAISEIRRVLGNKMTLSANAKLAILNTGEVKDFVLSATGGERALLLSHQPEEDDPSHSGIFGLLEDDLFVAKLIAEKILETYPARSQ